MTAIRQLASPRSGADAERPVLLVTTGELGPEVTRWAAGAAGGGRVLVLQLEAKYVHHALPVAWEYVGLADLGSLDELREAYLEYLEQIPKRAAAEGGSLDELFRRQDGYSLWWTEAGIRRNPTCGPFLKVRAVWAVQRALARLQPRLTLIHASDGRDVTILLGAARQVPSVRLSPQSAPAYSQPLGINRAWYTQWKLWATKFLRHRFWRAAILRTLCPVRGAGNDTSPVVVMSAMYPRHVGMIRGRDGVWYWDAIVSQLKASCPDLKVRYLLDPENPDLESLDLDFTELIHDTLHVKAIPDAVPLWLGHLRPAWLIRSLRYQLQQLKRFRRFAQGPGFREIFDCGGADLSDEFMAMFGASVILANHWEYEVDAATDLLVRLGNVKAVVVHQEFEPRGMSLIAACRRLGIPSVGFQHGTFYPLHTIYSPPASQIAASPTPDYFAVYGEYNREVVSKYGAYPADRVWTCAGTRFDALVTNPPDRNACREQLGLPRDRHLLLLTTQDYAWFPDAVRAVLAAVPEATLLCIKTYEAKRELYQGMIDQSRRRDTLLFTDRFDELLGACDALISASSTTMMEATLLGRPTVCLNFATDAYFYPYVEEGVSVGVRRAEELSAALAALLHFRPTREWHERRRRFLERHLGPAANGNAAAEFVRKLLTLIHGVERNEGKAKTEAA